MFSTLLPPPPLLLPLFPIYEVIAAANAAVKFGSAAMAAVAALTESATFALSGPPPPADACRPENFVLS